MRRYKRREIKREVQDEKRERCLDSNSLFLSGVLELVIIRVMFIL